MKKREAGGLQTASCNHEGGLPEKQMTGSFGYTEGLPWQ